MTPDAIIDEILAAEGGYVDDPDDRGGPTHFGITQATLSEWRGEQASRQDVRALTEDEAREIYRHRYLEEPRIDELPARLQPLLVDSAVQHGTGLAVRWLQEAAGTTTDGVIGPVTLEAVRDAPVPDLYRQVLAKRIRYYGWIISNDHSQARFALGWMRRVSRFVEEA